MKNKKPINPLQEPLQKLLKHAEHVMSIPGFASETLKKGVSEARRELAVKSKTKI